MKVYGLAPLMYSACSWYRTMLPWRTMQNMKLADPIIDQYDLNIPHAAERRAHATMYADICQYYNNYSPAFEISVKQAGDFGAYWESEDRWNFGPNLVMDTDDNIFDVEPLNPAFENLGWKVNGNVVTKNQAISLEIPDIGRKVLFQDGIEGFDVEANVKRVSTFRKNVRCANLLTTSTSRLGRLMAAETGQGNIHVYPNCIDFNDWPMVDLRQDDKKVKILWQSSSCHFEDMWPLAKIIGEIHRKYENVEMIIFGSPYAWLLKQLVPERTQVIGWVPYSNYPLRMSTLGHDINLAPLHDSTFNQCRSAIRMYESAATWKPAATLAENTGPFADEILEGQTGLLFKTPEEFRTKLEALIEDATLRKTIAANAKDWVRTNRDPAVHVPKLLEAYATLRADRRLVTLPPPALVLKDKHEPVPTVKSNVRKRKNANRGTSVEAEHNGVHEPSGAESPASS